MLWIWHIQFIVEAIQSFVPLIFGSCIITETSLFIVSFVPIFVTGYIICETFLIMVYCNYSRFWLIYAFNDMVLISKARA